MLPTNSVPLSPSTIARAFGTLSAKTPISKPGGNFILSSGKAGAAVAPGMAASSHNRLQRNGAQGSRITESSARFFRQRRQRTQVRDHGGKVGWREPARRVADDFFHRFIGGIAVGCRARQQKFLQFGVVPLLQSRRRQIRDALVIDATAAGERPVAARAAQKTAGRMAFAAVAERL